ncbi:hypothetical protein ABEB36_000076 [Hypothenemus hampei]|uniref:Uncharacterized protein n=1 Tax=Hypothenemus hampei TaxID=57062 RepID=A0ABD1FA83_HYPHA
MKRTVSKISEVTDLTWYNTNMLIKFPPFNEEIQDFSYEVFQFPAAIRVMDCMQINILKSYQSEEKIQIYV